jgi:hypothetical protein
MSESPPPIIDSRQSWLAALDWGVRTATEQRARSITCVDSDFAEWPLNDAAWLRQVTSFLRLPRRRLVLLAAGFGAIPRRHPRFIAWRRDWTHAIDTLQAPEEMTIGLPRVLLDDQALSVQLLESVHWKGRAAQNARVAHLLREQVDAVLQRSELSFPVNTLGL